MRIKYAMNIAFAMKVGSTVAGNVVDDSTWKNHVKVNPQNSCFLRLRPRLVPGLGPWIGLVLANLLFGNIQK
jgi:hypothetical protein